MFKTLVNKYFKKNGPAVEDIDGSKFWYFDGELHRKNGPVIILLMDIKNGGSMELSISRRSI